MFNNLNNLKGNIKTTLLGKELILKDLYRYQGPLTLQYLPNGGIQMIYQNQMIINTNLGYLATKKVIYDGIEYSIEELQKIVPNLVNLVLPN